MELSGVPPNRLDLYQASLHLRIHSIWEITVNDICESVMGVDPLKLRKNCLIVLALLLDAISLILGIIGATYEIFEITCLSGEPKEE